VILSYIPFYLDPMTTLILFNIILETG
jgi:hypothetical protein